MTYLEQLTLQPRPLGSAAAREALPVDPAYPCSLFRLSPATDDSGGHAVLDELGRSAGAHFCTVSELEIVMENLLPLVALCNRLTASSRVLLTQAYLLLGYWQPQCKSFYAAIVCRFWSSPRLCMCGKSCRFTDAGQLHIIANVKAAILMCREARCGCSNRVWDDSSAQHRVLLDVHHRSHSQRISHHHISHRAAHFSGVTRRSCSSQEQRLGVQYRILAGQRPA